MILTKMNAMASCCNICEMLHRSNLITMLNDGDYINECNRENSCDIFTIMTY